jgi:hypothetical protein
MALTFKNLEQDCQLSLLRNDCRCYAQTLTSTLVTKP